MQVCFCYQKIYQKICFVVILCKYSCFMSWLGFFGRRLPEHRGWLSSRLRGNCGFFARWYDSESVCVICVFMSWCVRGGTALFSHRRLNPQRNSTAAHFHPASSGGWREITGTVFPQSLTWDAADPQRIPQKEEEGCQSVLFHDALRQPVGRFSSCFCFMRKPHARSLFLDVAGCRLSQRRAVIPLLQMNASRTFTEMSDFLASPSPGFLPSDALCFSLIIFSQTKATEKSFLISFERNGFEICYKAAIETKNNFFTTLTTQE